MERICTLFSFKQAHHWQKIQCCGAGAGGAEIILGPGAGAGAGDENK